MARSIARYQRPIQTPVRHRAQVSGSQLLMRIVVGLIFVLSLASAVAIYFGQEDQFRRIEQRSAQLSREKAIADQRLQEQIELQSQVDTDAYVEHIARNKLGMVKPNEVIFEDPK